jgi:hypothetical protein
VREAMIVIWEASDRICGKRLRLLLPILVEAMERHGRLHLAPEVRARLVAMSAAMIDRALVDIRQQAGTATRRRSAPSAAIRRSVPARTFGDRDNPPPGFVEADLVAHSGPMERRTHAFAGATIKILGWLASFQVSHLRPALRNNVKRPSRSLA